MAAIATKKRLYTKALDALASTSQVSLATSDQSTTAKRPATAVEAFDAARERARKRLRHSTSSSSLAPVVLPLPSSTPDKADAKAVDPPNYAPWSHDAFLARLKTFASVSIWHPKPESINEVQWAKRGWSCVDVNTVRCRGGCEKRVVVSLEGPANKQPSLHTDDSEEGEDDEESAFEQALAERYQDMIVDGHAKSCLWRKGGCKDDIYHLQVVRAATWQPALRQRFESVMSVGSAVANVNLVSLEHTERSVTSTELLTQDLPAIIPTELSAQHDTQTMSKALDTALHGWRGSREAGSELLHCDACFQRIGLWMYQPDYRPSHARLDDDDNEDDNDPNDIPKLNLTDLHREHCPWRNPASQKASGDLSGLNACKILARVVATYARDQKRRADEQAGLLAVDQNQDEGGDGDGDENSPAYSKEEVARQDKERESRMRRLKSLFTIKRRSKSLPKPPPAPAPAKAKAAAR